ncbi:hypothetical protein R0131_06830 [Clostridium sp. AL.422]|uniref:hypothetical protein n=1 Tax=Clostridium TaxID=1485 RepID=UPI00293DD61A|nr:MULTISPECIES: hypothetical protein [unclassified Clostridium]MDV4150546.1 hypothetical protein [Clostridium sp. AL.422]
MNLRQTREIIISKLFIAYLELVFKTSKIVLNEFNFDINNSIIGFWHGDSYSMNLVVKKIINEKDRLNVIVTADTRGNYIENVLKKYKVKALRMPDGIRMKSFLRDLRLISKEENESIAIALDGPLGPYHIPKKIGFSLSKEANKKFIGIKLDYSNKISLKNRWDKYSIPLPFTTIKINIIDFGVVTSDNLISFKDYSEKIIKAL